jgi:hypothetical protein
MPTNPLFDNKIGKTYGMLTVVEYVGRKGEDQVWDCRCSCGSSVQVIGRSLATGNTKSCGCLNISSHTKHGDYATVLYQNWATMVYRCKNPRSKDYPRYGGRGVVVAEEFLDYMKFKHYVLKHLGDKPGPEFSLDRINNNKGYEPGNLRWATKVEQALNRRNTLYVTLCGEEVTLREACEIFGMGYSLVWNRLNVSHWPLVDALLTPVGKPRPIQPPITASN